MSATVGTPRGWSGIQEPPFFSGETEEELVIRGVMAITVAVLALSGCQAMIVLAPFGG